MITLKTVTLDTLDRDASDIELFFKSYLGKTGPYPAFPQKAEFLRRLWDADQASGAARPSSPRTFLFAADNKTSSIAFMAGIWYPAFDVAFVESMVRNRAVVYARQGAALMAYGLAGLGAAGVRHMFLPVPDASFWRHDEKPTALAPKKVEAWALAQGFAKVPFSHLTPPVDAKGRLREGYSLLYRGPAEEPLSVTARALGEEFRRLGLNPLLAAETVYRTARFDHTQIH